VPHEQKGPFINTQQIVTCAGLEPAPDAAVEDLGRLPLARPAAVKAAGAAPSSP
jgi:hypothetical protein